MENLPSELLLEIFSYLPFVRKHSLLFVSHRWFEHLKAGVWKEVYDHRLLNVTLDRRQMYASTVEALTLTSHKPNTHEELQGLEFTRLNTLICQISLDRFETSFDTSCLVTYLVPSLKSVTLDLVADADLLDRLANSCNLRHIAFDLRAKRVSEDSVLEFLERCPGIEHVGFYNGHDSYTSDSLYDGNFPSRILGQLAMQPSLRQIDSHHAIHGSTIDTADLSSISQPFASIERIETRESALPRFSMLIAECRKVDELHVQIDPKAGLAASRGKASAIPVSTGPRHLNIRR
ncbi:F-box protein [Aspergillus stella-maris]|uniref:F-box protein n=1 Tax=Aspergillus stella-maris TaxID=1810926 RepID=UPI003CCDF703